MGAMGEMSNYFRALWAALMGRTHPVTGLVPGKCECGHSRCCHVKGKYDCTVTPVPNDERMMCACEIYIRAVPITVDELEALYRK